MYFNVFIVILYNILMYLLYSFQFRDLNDPSTNPKKRTKVYDSVIWIWFGVRVSPTLVAENPKS
jgi:hypothetical protein